MSQMNPMMGMGGQPPVPGSMGAAMGGKGEMPACPFCGQPLPMPDVGMSAPNAPMPQGQLGIDGGGMQAGGSPQDASALLMALLGGGGGMR